MSTNRTFGEEQIYNVFTGDQETFTDLEQCGEIHQTRVQAESRARIVFGISNGSLCKVE